MELRIQLVRQTGSADKLNEEELLNRSYPLEVGQTALSLLQNDIAFTVSDIIKEYWTEYLEDAAPKDEYNRDYSF